MHNAFDIFLKFYLIVSTFIYWPGMMAYIPQEMFIQYSAVMFFALSLYVPKKREISNVYLSFILIYAILNTLIFHFTPRSQTQLINMFLGVLTLKIISERIDLNLKKIGWPLFYFCVFNLFWMWMQIYNQDPLFSPVEPDKKATIELVGLFNAKFALGVFSALVAPIIASISWPAALICAPLIFASKASTCMAAYVISMLFLLWFKNRKAFYVIAPLIAIAGASFIIFYDAPTGQFMKRIKVWQFAFHYVASGGLSNGIWFGLGLGGWAQAGFQTLQENGEPQWWSWAHNDWLQYLCEQGIIGSIFLYAYLKNFFKKINLNSPTSQIVMACFIALAICSFFHFPFRVGRLAGISLFILGLMEAITSQGVKHETVNAIPDFGPGVFERSLGLGNGNGSSERPRGDSSHLIGSHPSSNI